MRASTDRRTTDTATAFGAKMGGLVEAYAGFNARWPDAATIFAAKAEFGRDWRSLLKQLASRIERENLMLYPLADVMDAPAGRKSA